MTALREVTRRLLERLRPDDVPEAIGDAPVVAPSTADEAAEVLRHAAEEGLTVGFVGAGTRLGLGGPLEPDLWVSSSRMARVVDHQPADLTLTVEPGVTLGEIEELLGAHRQSAILPEGRPEETIGGVVAAGASGFRRLRYGPTRDRVLEVVLATGYGEVVRAGAPLVKNVTGYDLSRLVVGSLGSLGFVARICLKLWPEPPVHATVPVTDPAAALAATYRPLAVLETREGGFVYLGGTEAQVGAQAAALGAGVRVGLAWPDRPTGPVPVELRVPARALPEAVRTVRRLLPEAPFVAEHGVGVVHLAGPADADEEFRTLRRWAERAGGVVVRLGGYDVLSASEFPPWGAPPPWAGLQRRVVAAFDPAGVLAPGKLPGGLR
ncbi:MAG TPA: FAD-binding oxidoreductase [Actinobacteria bacterium]|nr:FAD-binding oxidoreductase [Actinomycetota bacterium]